jgi:hypothetical protein
MSRYRRGEYRAERRAKLAERPREFVSCQGDMGMCGKKDPLAPCGRCGKPYCSDHAVSHPRFCLGIR